MFYFSDMHVRPTRFSILCTPTDSSDKTRMMCSTILLCLFNPNTIMKTDWTAVPCPTINLGISICKSSARTKQSVINVALKTPLQKRLGICMYKTSLLHRPDDYIDFTRCPPHISQQNCAQAWHLPFWCQIGLDPNLVDTSSNYDWQTNVDFAILHSIWYLDVDQWLCRYVLICFRLSEESGGEKLDSFKINLLALEYMCRDLFECE